MAKKVNNTGKRADPDIVTYYPDIVHRAMMIVAHKAEREADRLNSTGDDDDFNQAWVLEQDAKDYRKLADKLLNNKLKTAVKFYDGLDSASRDYIFEVSNPRNVRRFAKIFDVEFK